MGGGVWWPEEEEVWISWVGSFFFRALFFVCGLAWVFVCWLYVVVVEFGSGRSISKVLGEELIIGMRGLVFLAVWLFCVF